MRTLTCTILAAAAILIGGASGAAQAPEGNIRPAVLQVMTPSPPPIEARTRLAVLGRLLSFDVNADHQITRDELPERMQALIARGDRNGNGALDMDEIHALVNSPSARAIRVSFHSQPFEGLPGVISDLKLSPMKRERALAIVSAHTPAGRVPDPLAGNASEPGTRDMYKEMRLLLDNEEYENFVAAATRLSKSQFRAGIPPGVVGGAVGGVVGRR
jgi:hypothetical protein